MQPTINQDLLVIFVSLMRLLIVFLASFTIWSTITITMLFLSYAKKQEIERKNKAAAAAVAIALAENQNRSESKYPIPSTAFVSAWQAVLRSNILNKHSQRR